jgi:hypothetical protein
MDVSGLSQFLLSLGPPGAIILYLLWRQRDLETRLEASQNAMVAMLEKATKEVTAALVASTEAMRANNAIQDAAGKSAAALASAVSHLGQKLEHLDDTIERIDRERS